MKKIFTFSIILFAFLSTASFAEDKHLNDLVVLNENTFVKIHNNVGDVQTIQLFKIEDNKIHLVDAILVDEKNVNFSSLYEYKRLKVEIKK